jgi:hypothetical protein
MVTQSLPYQYETWQEGQAEEGRGGEGRGGGCGSAGDINDRDHHSVRIEEGGAKFGKPAQRTIDLSVI